MSLKTKRIYEFGAFRLDASDRLLFQNGEAVPLPPKVVETLIALVENNGRLVEKEDLIKRVWPDTFVEENNLNKNVSILRKALGAGQDEQKFIETVPKRGYRFVAEVRSFEDEPELIIERSKARVVIEEEQEADEPQLEIETVVQQPTLEESGKAQLTDGHPAQANSHQRRFVTVAVIAVLVIVAAIGSWLIWRKTNRDMTNSSARTPAANAPLKTIAVLPFQPISADSRDQFLELGMADALITKLSNLQQIVVRPTSAIRKYTDINQDPLAAGRELQVNAVLVGNVQKVNDTLRATVQLINVEDGRPLWAEKFDAKFTDIFAVQDAISEKVTSALALQLTGDERARLAKRYTQSDEAYQLYQKGRYFLDSNTEENARKSLDFFRQATARDPNYALAFAGITRAYIVLSENVGGVSKEEINQARAAAERAIALDDTLAEAHHALATIEFSFDWNWEGAGQEFVRAIQLNPNDADTHQSYGDYLLASGRLEEGLAEAKRAVELDPLSAQNNFHLGLSYASLGRYDEALAQTQKTAELNIPYTRIQARLGRIYILKGMYNEAIVHYQKALDAGGDHRDALVGLAQGYALTGRRDEAQKMLDELLAQQKEHHTQYYYIALVQTALGQHDAALESLKKGVAAHEEGMLFLKVESRFDPLRSDSRFIELVRQVGIPQ